MQDILDESLKKLKKGRLRRKRMIALLLVLSLVVSLDVFWALRQPGWTLAGDADCGMVEHTHDAQCQSGDTPCPLQEHTHTIACYANSHADTETQLDWQDLFTDYPYTGDLAKDLVGIAKTQVGYKESEDNFLIGDDGVRRGYTRYGAWYGAPYGDWSAMFVSFCLHYAGADPNAYPANTGAFAMARLWEALGKYERAGTYHPSPGDLVFFTDNTVGIVSDVQTATMYVIRGDVNGAVTSNLMIQTDQSISGWGVLQPRNESAPEPIVPPTSSSEEILLGILNKPVFSITEGESETVQPKQRALFRYARTITEMIPYLEANGGSYFFTLMDFNNVELPKDEDGNYIAVVNEGYKLTVTFNNPEGFVPGTYQYQVPNGLMVDGGEGTFILKDGTDVGSWVVTDTGLITLVFNEHMNSRTDITISSTLGIHFPEQEEPIDFDGKITVKVKPAIPQVAPTVITKWGSQQEGTGKIYWTIRLDGHADSQIPGSILTDLVLLEDWTRPHNYTDSDIAGGLRFGVSSPDGGWHTWSVSVDDPHLVWDGVGWSYKIPKTVICEGCGELELGNDGWMYLINYTSTPAPLNTPGTFDYTNKVTVDGQTGWGWSNFNHGEAHAQVIKNGSFISDAGGGAFLWEVQALIPGRPEGQRALYSWFIMDEMRLLDTSGTIVGYTQNDINLAMVMATYNGATIQIPRIQDATDQDMFAWDNAWTATQNGIGYNRTINLLCRCQCTEDTCRWEGCGDYWYQNDDGTWASNGFCQCWTETQNMTFIFVYKTNDLSMLEGYGSLGYQVSNLAQLYYMPDSETSLRVSYDDATVKIPNLFEKQLTHDFDGYTANYKITINESKLVLTNGSPLYIRDEMTKTLAYISGSLVITAEDANGSITYLKLGTDYTVTYDGTGKQKDEQGNEVHVLDIVILHPQPVKYTLDYDTTLIFPEHVTGAIKYSNSATISLWGDSFKETTTEKVYADINIATKNYKTEMFKTSADTGEPLGGATFGLFNEHGGLITAGTTDANGKLYFQTNIVQGIILREHVRYYVQELNPPPGYRLDSTKHWFCFCDEAGDACEICDTVLAGVDAIRIPFEQIGVIRVTNEFMHYSLPETGGVGTTPLILVSTVFIAAPLVYISIRKRKREGRGDG